MQLYNLSRNKESIIGGQIGGREDMQFLQTWCETNGYACYVNVDQNGQWTGNITTPTGQQLPLAVGLWAVLKNGVELNVYTPDQGGAHFTVGAPIE